eukprot:6794514-Prymnesium_polylepis.5
MKANLAEPEGRALHRQCSRLAFLVVRFRQPMDACAAGAAAASARNIMQCCSGVKAGKAPANEGRGPRVARRPDTQEGGAPSGHAGTFPLVGG